MSIEEKKVQFLLSFGRYCILDVYIKIFTVFLLFFEFSYLEVKEGEMRLIVSTKSVYNTWKVVKRPYFYLVGRKGTLFLRDDSQSSSLTPWTNLLKSKEK